MEPSELIESLDAKLAKIGIELPSTCEHEPSQGVPPYFYNGQCYYFADANGHFFPMDRRTLEDRLYRDGFFIRG